MRLPSILIAALVAAGVTASPAAADSIVYVKQGNLYLSSPDGSQGYQLTSDGVHVMTMPDCTDHLLIPGGAEPAFGPADVKPTRAPGAGSGGSDGTAVTLGGVSLHPRAFRARRGTTVRFTLSAPARVTLAAGRVKRTVAARAGANAVRWRPRLRPGRHRLRLGAGSASATARFTVKR